MATTAPSRGQRRPKTLRPFTLEHFRAYTSRIILDTGEYWELEDFQAEVVEPVLAGVLETWTLLPEGCGKTTLLAGLALYHCDYTVEPWVPIAASSRDQAEIMAQQGYGMIERSPGMPARFRVYKGYRVIRSRRNGGTGIKVYAADQTTADGVIPTLAIVDEGHRHPDLGLYRLWKGKLNKRGGQIVMISTAGEPGSDFETTRDSIRDSAVKRRVRGAHVRSEGENIVMNEWQVQDARMVTDMAAVKEASPLSTITEDTLREEYESPTTDLGLWKRLKCNLPARASNTAVTEGEWDGIKLDEEIPEGEHVDCGLDLGWKHDTTALVPLWNNTQLVRWEQRKGGEDEKWPVFEGYRLAGAAHILEPPRDGSMLKPDAIKRAVEAVLEFNPIDVVVMDMSRGEDIAAWLEDEKGITVIDRPQGNALAAQDYEEFMEALRNKTLRHVGHSGLRAQVMNAITRLLPGDKKRFDRPSQSRASRKQEVRVIDALTALAMVNWYQANPEGEGRSFDLDDYHIEAL